MLDYSLSIEEEDNFILNFEEGVQYTIDENGKTTREKVILVHYSNGAIDILENTNENKIDILSKMKFQVTKAYSNIEDYETLEKEHHNRKFINYSVLVASLCLLTKYPDSSSNIVLYVLSGLEGIKWIKNIVCEKYAYRLQKDIKKNKYFIDNEESFNNKINLNDLNNYTQEQLEEIVGQKLELKK